MLSVEGVIGKEPEASNEQLDYALSNKFYMYYSETFRCVWSHLSLNLVQPSILLVWGTWSDKIQQARRMKLDGKSALILETWDREWMRSESGKKVSPR